MHVTVVGAGVIGLSTALVLEERGAEVTLLARDTLDATTSAVAGAVWFPYRAGPRHLVAAWAARTRAYLIDLAARDPAAGVDVLDGYEIDDDPATPWWAVGLAEVAHVTAPVAGAPKAWRFIAPRVEPAIYLPYLMARLRAQPQRVTVDDLRTLAGPVVNCTGLGARTLANDVALEPILGQIVVTRPGAVELATTVTDERDPDAIFYVIPRRDELVLGGCTIPTAGPPTIDPAITTRILEHARRLGLAPGELLRERAGLRPYRPTVRLERDPAHPNIVHNYGHGGAGFTLSRGCAEDAATLALDPPEPGSGSQLPPEPGSGSQLPPEPGSGSQLATG